MIQKIFTVENKFGIHARPATQIVNELNQYQSEVTFIKDGIEANAKSILNLLMLTAEYKSKIKVIVEGSDEELVIEKIKHLLSKTIED